MEVLRDKELSRELQEGYFLEKFVFKFKINFGQYIQN
ncbi:MAG: hypothetical protein PG979_000664 [Rickettsia asembonensis]|nr:MAG: hypothetical protein PG979_000144 [Rickettsia asembonensis]WCR56607.1 MAG: hypothetical protein PG979_000664 [Rickettsia asembonensis]